MPSTIRTAARLQVNVFCITLRPEEETVLKLGQRNKAVCPSHEDNGGEVPIFVFEEDEKSDRRRPVTIFMVMQATSIWNGRSLRSLPRLRALLADEVR